MAKANRRELARPGPTLREIRERFCGNLWAFLRLKNQRKHRRKGTPPPEYLTVPPVPQVAELDRFTAKICGMTPESFSRVRQGSRNINRASLKKLENVLGVGATNIDPRVLTAEFAAQYNGQPGTEKERRLAELLELNARSKLSLRQHRELFAIRYWDFMDEVSMSGKATGPPGDFSWKALDEFIGGHLGVSAKYFCAVRLGRTHLSDGLVRKLFMRVRKRPDLNSLIFGRPFAVALAAGAEDEAQALIWEIDRKRTRTLADRRNRITLIYYRSVMKQRAEAQQGVPRSFAWKIADQILAKHAGVEPSAYREVRHGRRNLSAEALGRLEARNSSINFSVLGIERR